MVVEVVVVVVAFVGRETGIPEVPAASFGDSIGEAGGPSNRSRCGFSLSFIKDQKAYLRRVTVRSSLCYIFVCRLPRDREAKSGSRL